MQTDDFTRPITSFKLKENLAKQFGMRVNLEKYDREQLENIRNLVRTRTHSAEQKISENDLLANEDYQKDKAMLQLLNTRIKEMLGEDIKKLRDKLDQLNEAKEQQLGKKKCPPMSHVKKMCQDGKSVAEICKMHPDCDHKELKQMVADCKDQMDEGKMPMKKVGGKSVPAFAADGKGKNDLSKNKDAKMKEAIKKNRKEFEGNAVTGGLADPSIPVGSKIPGTNVVKKKQIETESMKEDDEDERGGDQKTKSKFNQQQTAPGVTRYTKKSKEFTSEPHRDTGSGARTKADTQIKHNDEVDRARYKGLRQVRKDGETQYFYNGEEITKAQHEKQRRLNAMGVRENANGKTCNKSSKGKRCPVHGLQECGMGVYESIDPDQAGFYVVDEEGNVVDGPFDLKQEAYEQAAEMGRMYDVKYMGDVIPTSSLIKKIIRALSPKQPRSDDITDPMDIQNYLEDNPKALGLVRVFNSLSSQEQAHVTDEVANYFYRKNGSAFGDLDEGEDEGKPGKNFAKIAKDAGKRYGSKEAGERVAGAVRNKLNKQGKLEESNRIFKRHVRIVNESLAYLLSENEEDKAKAITAAGDIVNDYTSWMQRVGQYQTKSMIELSDSIRGDFGVQQAEAFKNSVGPALAATLEILTAQREAISNAVAVLAGEQIPEVPMGAEPGMEPGMAPAAPDMMNEPAGDEFAAADAAAGEGTTGREMRESAKQRRARKLAESHSIISKLAR
jgi:hypothetical protein